METLRLYCTVFEIWWVLCQNLPTLIYPTCMWLPCWGWPRSNFEKIFGIRKLVTGLLCGVVCLFLCLAILVDHRLVTDRHTDKPTDRQTDADRQTDRHRAMAYTTQSIARAVKIRVHGGITNFDNVYTKVALVSCYCPNMLLFIGCDTKLTMSHILHCAMLDHCATPFFTDAQVTSTDLSVVL